MEKAQELSRSRWPLATGWNRLVAPASVTSPSLRAPLERPLVILALLFALSLWTIFNVDRPIAIWMRAFPEELSALANHITRLGAGVEVLVGSGALLILLAFLPRARLRRRIVVGANAVVAAAGFVFLSVAGGGLAVLITKYSIGRARPAVSQGEDPLDFQVFALNPNYAAFPSGHATTAGAMAMALALVFPRFRSIFISIGILISLSRQLVGVHWPSDTIMGWAVGVGFTFWLAHIFARRRLLFVYSEDGSLRPRLAGMPLVSLLLRNARRTAAPG